MDTHEHNQPIQMNTPESTAKPLTLPSPEPFVVDKSRYAFRPDTTQGMFELVGKIVHDFSSPLAAMGMLLHSTKEIPAREHELFQHLLGRMREMTRLLLAEYRQKDKQRPVVQPEETVFVSDAVKAMIAEKQVQYKSLNVVFGLCLGPEMEDALLRIPASSLNRALSNLIDNAVEAKADVVRVALEWDAAGRQGIKVQVIDNGTGIPPALLERIRRGVRVTSKPHGNGLGLKSVMETVEKEWKGSFNIISDPHKGTVVEMSMPV